MPSRYIRNMRIENPYPEDYGGENVYDVDFLAPLEVRREIKAVKSRRGREDAQFLLGAPYRITYRLKGDPKGARRVIEVPRGMLTDLASVPRFARWLISQVGSHLEASIVHDYLYMAWQDVPGRETPRNFDRLFADKVLLAGMIDAKVARWRRALIYLAVRVGGRGIFRERDRNRYYEFWSPAPAAAIPPRVLVAQAAE